LDWSRLAQILDTTYRPGLDSQISLAEAQAVIGAGFPKNCSGEKALGYAEFMGKAMPTGQGTDFDIWTKDAAIIFSEYAEADVRIAVEHPTRGLRAKHKWLPSPSEIITFLDEMKTRRYRIISNARHIVAELTKPKEIEYSPEHRAEMARKWENLSREMNGRYSMEAQESVMAEQEKFRLQCLTVGDGDYQRGLELMLGLSEPPEEAAKRIGAL